MLKSWFRAGVLLFSLSLSFSDVWGQSKNSIASGNWNNPAIWSPAGVPDGTVLTVINPAHTVTLTGPITHAELVRVNGIMNLSGFAFNIGDLDGTGTITSASAATLTVGSKSSANTFAGAINGAVTLAKTGTEVLTISGTSAYTGATQVQQGTLRVVNNSSLGATSLVTVSSGATLMVSGGFTTDRNVTLNGTGVGGNGALVNETGINTLSGTITLASAASISVPAGTLSLTNAAAINMSTFALTFNNPGAATISGGIAGTGVFTKTGAGVLTLSSANSFSGNKTISEGAINVQNATALGSAGTITVNSGAALQIQGGITFARPVTVNGTGIGNTGAIRNISGNNTLSGLITLASAARIQSDANTLTLTAATAISATNQNLTLSGSGAISITGIIATGTGSLTKEGSGTSTLTAANTFTGGTTISAGAINVQNASALGSSGTINVASGGTFQIQGGLTFARPLTINGTGASNTGAIRNISGDNTLSATITMGSAARINSDAGTLTLSNASSVTSTNQALTLGGNGNITVSGTVGIGTAALSKDGNGTAILSIANSYTGNTNISAGALVPVVANAFGTAGTVVVTGNGTLQLQNAMTFARPINLGSVGNGNVGGIRLITSNVSISGLITLTNTARINADANTLTLTSANPITGTNQSLTIGGAGTVQMNRPLTTTTGTFNRDGTGTLLINAENTNTGLTTLSGGTFTYQRSNVVGTGSFTVSGGTLNLNGFNDTVAVFTVTGGTVNGPGTIYAQGTYVFSGTATIGVNLGGDVGLNKTGGGTTTLTGSNSFTGQVWIQNGTLAVTSLNSVVGGSPTSNLGAPTNATDGMIRFGTGGSSGVLTYSGAGETSDRMYELVGTTGNGTINSNGSGPLVLTGDVISDATGTSQFILSGTNGGNNIFSGEIQENTGTGVTAFTKTGPGLWILARENGYLGASTISGGTLRMEADGALGQGTTLVISGTSTKLLLAPSVGNITITQAITISNNSIATGAIESANGDNVLAGTITVSGTATTRYQANTGSTLTYSGAPAFAHAAQTVVFQGAGNHTIPLGSNFTGTTGALTKEGSGTLFMNGSKFTTGTNTITAGTIVLGGNERFAAGSIMSVTGTLNLNGFSQTVNGLAGGGTVTTAVSATCSLIINNTAGQTFSGGILDGSGVLTVRKLGSADQTFSGNTSNYTGQTYIGGGRLIVSNNITNSGSVSSIGAGTASPTIVIEGGATFAYSGGTPRTTNRAFQVIGTGTIEMSGNTTLTLQGGVNSTGGTVTFNTSGGTGRIITVNTNAIDLGSGNLIKTGTGVLNINIPSTYTGNTIISQGTLAVGVVDAIPVVSRLTNEGTLQMNGFAVTVAGILSSAGGSVITGSGAPTFTISRSGTDTLNYVGSISGGVAVTKAGTYTQVFSGNNTYNGFTTINGGVLRANSSGAFSPNSRHNLANAAGVELDMTGYDMSLQTIEGGGPAGGTVVLGTALLTLTRNTDTYTYGGRILGDGLAGGIQKQGSGIFVLTNSPEYEGFTRVRAGVLRAGADIDFAGTLIIVDTTSGTRFDCGVYNSSAPFLSFNSTRQEGGTWGSTASAATNKNNTYFTAASTGTIFINDGRREGYWLGTVSSNWFTPGNWHDNIVPTSTTEVVLEDMSINAPVLNGTGDCGNLIILPGAQLTLQGSSTLNVHLEIFNNGRLIPNNSTVVLRRATGITRVIARPNGTDPDFARVEYLGTGTVRFQTSVASPVYLTGSLVNSSTGTYDFRGKNFRCGLLEGTGTLTNSLGFPTLINIEAASGAGVFSGVINNGVGGIALAKSGASTQTLSGTNTFADGVSLTEGTLRVLDNASALGSGTLTISGTTPTVELSRTSAGTLTLPNSIQVSANTTFISNVNTAGAGTTFTLGTLSVGTNTITIQGGANVNSGTANIAFGAVTHTGTPTYTVTNPAGGGTTRLSLGTLTGAGFRTFFNGNGEVVQSGAWTIATATNDSAITYNGTGSLTLNQANTLSDRISLQSGVLIASENAGALGTATIFLRGGRLRLQGDAPVNFGRAIVKHNDLGWLESDRLTPGPGVTHIMGNLTLQNTGTDSVLVDAGPNVTSGFAGVAVATLTTIAATTHVIDTNALLSVTSMSGNHTLTKRGLGQTRVTGAVSGNRTAATTVTEGSLRIELTNSISSSTGTLNLDSGSVLELAGDANTTFNGTSVLLRGTSQIIRIDRLTPSATEVTHTLTNLSWNANNLELEVQRGDNITGTALGILSMTALTQNTVSRTYNYLTRPFARVSWPTYNVSAGGVVVNHRGQGILGQLSGTVLTTLAGTVFNQLGGGQFWLNGNNGTLQTTLNIDSGQLVLEGRQQVRIINLNAVGQVNPLDDTSFALSMAFGGVRQAPRLYGSTASTAQFQDNTRFTPGSTGLLGLKGYLEFRTNPAGGRSSLPLATAPVIQVRDSTGLLISNAQNNIPVRAFLSQTDTLGRGILRGDSVETMVIDSVRFDSLRLGGIVGFFYRIAFIVDSLVTPAIESPNLTLSPGPIDPSKSSVIFSVDTAIANGIDSALITVLIQDIDENKIINEEVFVTQPPGKVSIITALNGGLSNVDGIALFSVKSTVADSIDYQAIVQVDDDEPFGDSARVYFVPGPPFRLSYLHPPFSAAVDVAFFPFIEVLIFDSLNNKMWTDTNRVNIELIPSGVINGPLTSIESGGNAVFPLISIGTGGTYVLRAFTPSWPGVEVNSLPFDIIDQLYKGGDGDGHALLRGREQNLNGRFVLRITGTFTAASKIYDGTTFIAQSSIASNGIGLTNIDDDFPNVQSDSIAFRFISPTVGDARTVIIDTVLLSGADLPEYVLSLSNAPTGTAKIKGQSYFGGDGRGDVMAQSDTLFLDGVAPVPTRLALLNEPGDQLANTEFVARVRLVAANGRRVPFGAASATAAFFANPGSASLGGTTTRSFTAGEAVFNDLSINSTGLGYQVGFEPVSPGYPLDTVVTAPFDVYAVYSGGNGRGDTALNTPNLSLDGRIIDGWVGGASGNPLNWYTNANWSSGLAPRDTSIIIIPFRLNAPRLNRSATPAENAYTLGPQGRLFLLDQATLTIDSGTTGASAANGPLFVLADGSRTETFGNSRIIVEPNARYVNLSTSQPLLESRQRLVGRKGWRQISSPVRTTYADWLDSLETAGYPGSKFDSLQPNILWFAETDTGTTLQSWRLPTNGNDTIVPGRGYYAYVFDGAAYPARVTGGGNFADELPITLTATGREPDLGNGGSFNFDLTFTPRSLSTAADTVGGNRFFLDENVADEGWNLVGNPTASVLNWDNGWSSNNLNQTFYIWDPNFGNDAGGYRYWNGSIGNVDDTTLENGLLAPYQAFWVHANAANPTLSFTNAAKSNEGRPFQGRRSTPPSISLSLEGQGMRANSFVSFGPEGITGPDVYDGYQLESYDDNWLLLYTHSSVQHRKPLVINHLPDQVNEELAIPVQLSAARNRNPITGQYSLSWNLSENWPSHWAVALMDHHQQKVVPMFERRQHSFTYEAPATPAFRSANENGDFRTPEGVLHGQAKLPLFRQQRPPQRPFTIVIIPNHDGSPIAYRPDHAYLYPPAPNPFVHETTLAFYLPLAGEALLEVTDMFGRVISREPKRHYAAGTHEIVWDATRLRAGTYLVRLVTNDFVSTQKAVKVR